MEASCEDEVVSVTTDTSNISSSSSQEMYIKLLESRLGKSRQREQLMMTKLIRKNQELAEMKTQLNNLKVSRVSQLGSDEVWVCNKCWCQSLKKKDMCQIPSCSSSNKCPENIKRVCTSCFVSFTGGISQSVIKDKKKINKKTKKKKFRLCSILKPRKINLNDHDYCSKEESAGPTSRLLQSNLSMPEDRKGNEVNETTREYIPEEDKCPLNISNMTGAITFHVKWLPFDRQIQQKKEREMMSESLPFHLELTPDEGDQIVRLQMSVTEVGTEVGVGGVMLPGLLPRHCLIAHTEGAVTVTPCSPQAEVIVNNQRATETTILQHGSVVKLANTVWRFLDPASMENPHLLTAESAQTSSTSSPATKVLTRSLSTQTATNEGKYSEEEMRRATLLMYSSIKTYKLLRKFSDHKYPCISTIRKHIQDFHCCYGLNEEMFQLLSIKLQTMSDLDRNVSIVFDEMDLQPTTDFSSHLKERLPKSKKALVVIVRGLKKSFKEIVYYNFDRVMERDRGKGKSNLDMELLGEIIAKVEDAGARVRAVTLDMGNRVLLSECKVKCTGC